MALTAKNYLDLTGLQNYDQKLKDLMNSQDISKIALNTTAITVDETQYPAGNLLLVWVGKGTVDHSKSASEQATALAAYLADEANAAYKIPMGAASLAAEIETIKETIESENGKVGTLTNLATTDVTDLVAAINETATGAGTKIAFSGTLSSAEQGLKDVIEASAVGTSASSYSVKAALEAVADALVNNLEDISNKAAQFKTSANKGLNQDGTYADTDTGITYNKKNGTYATANTTDADNLPMALTGIAFDDGKIASVDTVALHPINLGKGVAASEVNVDSATASTAANVGGAEVGSVITAYGGSADSSAINGQVVFNCLSKGLLDVAKSSKLALYREAGTSSTEYAARYHLIGGATTAEVQSDITDNSHTLSQAISALSADTIGTIDIGKEMVATSGQLYVADGTEDAGLGLTTGATYIEMTIANGDPFYIPVNDLIDLYYGTANKADSADTFNEITTTVYTDANDNNKKKIKAEIDKVKDTKVVVVGASGLENYAGVQSAALTDSSFSTLPTKVAYTDNMTDSAFKAALAANVTANVGELYNNIGSISASDINALFA